MEWFQEGRCSQTLNREIVIATRVDKLLQTRILSYWSKLWFIMVGVWVWLSFLKVKRHPSIHNLWCYFVLRTKKWQVGRSQQVLWLKKGQESIKGESLLMSSLLALLLLLEDPSLDMILAFQVHSLNHNFYAFLFSIFQPFMLPLLLLLTENKDYLQLLVKLVVMETTSWLHIQ